MGFGWRGKPRNLVSDGDGEQRDWEPFYFFLFLIALELDEKKKKLSRICDAIQQNPTSRNAVFADVNVRVESRGVAAGPLNDDARRGSPEYSLSLSLWREN